jgi:hypothetical protein
MRTAKPGVSKRCGALLEIVVFREKGDHSMIPLILPSTYSQTTLGQPNNSRRKVGRGIIAMALE